MMVFVQSMENIDFLMAEKHVSIRP